MAKKPLPCPTVLRQLLRYEAETGKLFWKERSPIWVKSGKRSSSTQCAVWNAKYAGEEAFKFVTPYGYLSGKVFNKSHLAHRVVWAIFFGAWPSQHIDHINGDRLDNRIKNLRDVSQAENNRNLSLSKINTSGFTGVYWCARDKWWVSKIKVSGRDRFLGNYKHKQDAIDARIQANVRYQFHENHGKPLDSNRPAIGK